MKKIYAVKLILTCSILALGLTIGAQPANLVAHYKFDETSDTIAADASGHGFNGNVHGTVNWVEGTIGGALELTATADGDVTLPAAKMGMTALNGSVALWMKCDVPTSIYTLFWGGDNTTGSGFGPELEMHIHIEQAVADIWTGGEVGFWVRATQNLHIFSDPEKGTSAGVPPVNPKLVSDTLWHHLAATWGAGNAQLYIDGEKIMEGTLSIAPDSIFPLSNMYIGRMAGGGRRFIGMLDDYRIYKGILHESVIRDLYNKVSSIDNHLVNDLTELITYPNPAAGKTTIRFKVPDYNGIKVSLLNLNGQVLDVLYEGSAVPGYNFVPFNADGYPAGVYMVKLQFGENTGYTKILIK